MSAVIGELFPDVKEKKLTAKTATGVLLIEGFVSVSVQMIVLRQLVPFVGSSINITSVVITVFLAALAAGYRTGGRITKNPAQRIERNLISIVILIAVGLSYAVTEALFNAINIISQNEIVAAGLYALLIVSPLVFYLAQTVVLLIHYRKKGGAAQQAGDTFHISTLGNVGGGLVTTLVTMYYLGVGAAVTINAFLIIVAYMLVTRKPLLLSSSIGISLAMVAIILNVGYERVAFDHTDAYANYYISQDIDDYSRFLMVNGQNASKTNPENKGHPYIEYFERQILNKQLDKKILVLGAGGFTFGLGHANQANITFVDVDSQLADISQTFLSLNRLPGKFIAKDARAYLIQSDIRYDNIILDVFSHGSSIPTHLVTQEFFELARTRLVENGRLFINLIV